MVHEHGLEYFLWLITGSICIPEDVVACSIRHCCLSTSTSHVERTIDNYEQHCPRSILKTYNLWILWYQYICLQIFKQTRRWKLEIWIIVTEQVSENCTGTFWLFHEYPAHIPQRSSAEKGTDAMNLERPSLNLKPSCSKSRSVRRGGALKGSFSSWCF